jgi:hypothetical protein
MLGTIGAVLSTVAYPTRVSANDCAQRCYAQENSCRRATKDSPSCGAQLTSCLRGCRKQR